MTTRYFGDLGVSRPTPGEPRLQGGDGSVHLIGQLIQLGRALSVPFSTERVGRGRSKEPGGLLAEHRNARTGSGKRP